MFWCKFGEDVCNSQDEPVTACSFVWKLEARVGSEKVSMFAKRMFNVTNLFFLDSDWSGHSSKCAFVGWIFACWLCGHVFKCCKHAAMHFIVNVENLIQVMALMRSFFIFHHFVCLVCAEDTLIATDRTMWNSSPPSSALADISVSGWVWWCLSSAICVRRHFKSLATGSMQTIVESGHNCAIVTIRTVTNGGNFSIDWSFNF